MRGCRFAIQWEALAFAPATVAPSAAPSAATPAAVALAVRLCRTFKLGAVSVERLIRSTGLELTRHRSEVFLLCRRLALRLERAFRATAATPPSSALAACSRLARR